MRFHVALLASCLLTLGCATWDGTLNSHNSTVSWNPWDGAPQIGRVWFEKPVVTDKDRQKDFTNIADNYATSLQANMAGKACGSFTFHECLTERSENKDTYRISTTVEILNYRPVRGDGAGISIAGALLPPLLGLVWSFPAGMGDLKATVKWSLLSPDGEILVSKSGYFDSLFAPDGKGSGDPVDFNMPYAKFLGSAVVAIAKRESSKKTTLVHQTPPDKAAPVGVSQKPGTIVAVFDIEDMSGTIPKDVLNQLTNYFAANLGQLSEYRIVPRDQIREQLMGEQRKTYRECFDQSCQVELGRALAAEKSLSTQIIRLGDRCAVTSTVFDLRSETTDQAASVDSACSDDALMDALKRLAEQIRSK